MDLENLLLRSAERWKRSQAEANRDKKRLQDVLHEAINAGAVSEYKAAEYCGVTRLTIRNWQDKPHPTNRSSQYRNMTEERKAQERQEHIDEETQEEE